MGKPGGNQAITSLKGIECLKQGGGSGNRWMGQDPGYILKVERTVLFHMLNMGK